MKILRTITDLDIGSNILAPESFLERKASRAVVFDADRKVALFHATKKRYHKLPGGGVEDGEDLETALRRELLEEIGCNVKDIRELGIVEEFRNAFGLHQFSYCFLATVDGAKGEPNLEQGEIDEGFVTEWEDLAAAIEILRREDSVEDYQGKFIRMRDLWFLEEAQKVVQS